MTNPAQTAAGQRAISASAAQFMGMSFRAIADAFKATAGPSFQDAMFVSHVGNVQLNRVGQTNEAGDMNNTILRVCTAGVWNNVAFQIAAPSDRFRVILGLKLTLYSLADSGAIGGVDVPAGIAAQAIAQGLLRLDRSRGRSVTSRAWQFMTGADNRRFRQAALAAGAQAQATTAAQPRIPSEQEILPWGLQTALWTSIDALNPKDRSQFTFEGLNGVAAAESYDGDLGLGVDAIVFDAVMSGQ